ncbi:hypothetical protein [Roseovarius sp.]|uniref:hypothetical protein n=1 Tax=Roseovarius sp. TaxID=1486281 RepID=UPI0026065D56|nr:hypothetical protein [Roseovarius sp.]MDM8167017.1 hypothetical protein [Roseovarius sp.]
MDHVDSLLKMVDLSDDKEARRWLSIALDGLTLRDEAFNQVGPKAHDEILSEIEQLAAQMQKRLRRLRAKELSRAHSDFWAHPGLGPIAAGNLERPEVLATLSAIQAAAAEGQWNTRGQPPKHRKQAIIDAALAFFVRFVDGTPSGTPSGDFGQFAFAFHSAVTGSDESVDGQVRSAVKGRLEVVRARID